MGLRKAGRISIALAIHSLDRSAHPTYYRPPYSVG